MSGGAFLFNTLSFSTSAESPAADEVIAWDNRLIVESGGAVTGGFFQVQGRACEVRVDDASFVMTNMLLETDSLIVGYSYEYGGIGTNCLLTAAGPRPEIRLAGGLSVRNASTVRFELPAGGYDDGYAPVTAGGNVEFKPGCGLELSGTEALVESQIAKRRRGEYVLIENPQNRSFVDDSVVERANAALGDHCRLFKRVKDGRNQLCLLVRIKKVSAIRIR